jgi:hypothetical protein
MMVRSMSRRGLDGVVLGCSPPMQFALIVLTTIVIVFSLAMLDGMKSKGTVNLQT